MIKTKITCDYCGKETTNAYYSLFANFDGHVLGKNEICSDCWAFAKKALDDYTPVKIMDTKDFKNETLQ